MAKQAPTPTEDADAALCCAPIINTQLSESEANELASVFAALGDPVRLRLLSIVANEGEVCSCNLEAPLAKSQPTISHHTRGAERCRPHPRRETRPLDVVADRPGTHEATPRHPRDLRTAEDGATNGRCLRMCFVHRGTDGHSTGGGTITYTYVVESGQTIPANYSSGHLGAQFGGTGSPRSTSGDTWTVVSTSGGVASTMSGTF